MQIFRYDQVDWDKMFAPQMGGSRFRGYPYQRGGSIPGLFRAAIRIVPAFLASPLGKELLSGAVGTVNDIRSGTNPLTAIRTRGREVIRKLVGIGKKRPRKAAIQAKKPSRKRPLFVPAL